MARKLKPILDVLPVRVQDDLAAEKQRDTSRPWPLSFPAAEEFLQLDGEKKDPLAGWSEFCYGKKRDDWQKTEDEPVRGFFTAYPLKGLKPGAVTLAAFRDPASRMDEGGGKRGDLPYLVTMSYGKGRTICIGSSETWRLRQFREECHERLWTQLARHAAGRPVRKP